FCKPGPFSWHFPGSSPHKQNKSVLFCMAKIIEVPHKGVTVKIRELTTLKNKTLYTEFQITEYTTGKRVRHSRATLEEAKTKAKEIAEAMVAGKREVLEWDVVSLISD